MIIKSKNTKKIDSDKSCLNKNNFTTSTSLKILIIPPSTSSTRARGGGGSSTGKTKRRRRLRGGGSKPEFSGVNGEKEIKEQILQSTVTVTKSIKRSRARRRRKKVPSSSTSATFVSTDSNMDDSTPTAGSSGPNTEIKINNTVVVETTLKSSRVEEIKAHHTTKGTTRSRRPSSHQKKSKTKVLETIEKERTNVSNYLSDTLKKLGNKPMEDSETIRKWFTNLPSGAARACAASIKDDLFIKRYLELYCKYQLTVSSTHHSTENDDAVINAIISGADAGFLKETSVENASSNPFRIPEFQLSTNDLSIMYEPVPDMENEIQVETHDELECVSLQIGKNLDTLESQIEDPSSCTELCSIEDETITTLHFSSGLTIPISSNVIDDDATAQSNFVNEEEPEVFECYEQSANEKSCPPIRSLVTDVETKCIIADTTYTISQSVNSAKREVVAAKIQASKALECRANVEGDHNELCKVCTDSAEVNKSDETIEGGNMWLAIQALETLHKHTRFASTTMAKRFENISNGKKQSDTPAELSLDTLCLDPDYLSIEHGAELIKLANCIIPQYHCSGPVPGFLSTQSVEYDCEAGTISEKWPRWLYGCINYQNGDKDNEDAKAFIPFHILLLAKIERSILDSFYHGFEDIELSKQSRKDSSTFGELKCIFRQAKKLRQLAEDVGDERCREFSIQLCNLLFSNTAKESTPIIKSVPRNDQVMLEQTVLIPFSLLLLKSREQLECIDSQQFLSDVNSILQQLQSIVSEAIPTLTQEVFIKEEIYNVSSVSINNNINNKSVSRNKKKNKKKKKKRKNSNTCIIPERQQTQSSPASVQKTSSLELPVSHPTCESFENVHNISESATVIPNNVDKEANEPEEPLPTVKPSSVDVTLRVQGPSAVVVEQHNPNASEAHNDEAWSKVENKSRGNRARNSQKSNSDTSVHGSQSKSGKVRSGRTSASRKRIANRKIVKDIMTSILEKVDIEITRRRRAAMKARSDERRRKDEERRADEANRAQDRPSSLRDVVIGRSTSLQSSRADIFGTGRRQGPPTPLSALYKLDAKVEKDLESHSTKLQKLTRRQLKNHNADQNTVPTLPETLSGVSAMSTSNNSGGSVEDRQQENNSNDSSDDQPTKSESVSPPLPTLLSGVRHSTSASSSVASSLEAHGSGEQNVSGKEGDVGYHLLSVCGRLSNDMTTFMARRRCALELRRRERGALLVALQDVAVNIWAGRCHAEMYGSCATQLDLPSSDLDVVICGLPNSKGQRKKKHDHMDPMDHNSYNGYYSVNGGRVLRLAGELERQPWVVQVKAIPTASVPVIKILADPARLGGLRLKGVASGHEMGINASEYCPPSSGSGDWMMQANGSPQMVSSQNIVPQPTNPSSMQHNFIPNTNDPSSSPPVHPMSVLKPYPNPWRGADVMNGLISMDITFEGPEHGGVGSTAYSARIVQDACNETGLSPESTPAVQVTMVLKELLAQRRLNEPFSGGLSSYAILLMVVAIIQERKAIRAEMDLAERQRRAVSAPPIVRSTSAGQSKTDSTSPCHISASNTKLSSEESTASDRAPTATVTESVPSSNSSWASIAKQTNLKRTISKDKLRVIEQDGNTEPQQIEQNKNESSPAVDNAVHEKAKNDQTDDNKIQSSQNEGNPPTPMYTSSYVPHVQHPNANISVSSSFNFSQGSNDVLEVLCSGEPSAGKLLMHFLLFYGQYFDAQTMLIDVMAGDGRGPFGPRKSGGSIDPITGMYTVDPLVVYDPLECTEKKNVSRSCFAWSNIRHVFSQCYTTLQHTVERRGRGSAGVGADYGSDTSRLLELLLSY